MSHAPSSSPLWRHETRHWACVRSAGRHLKLGRLEYEVDGQRRVYAQCMECSEPVHPDETTP